jgi:hypothetical protein
MRATPSPPPILIASLLAMFFCGSIAFAQTRGTITGRVLSDDGGGLPNITVTATAVGSKGGIRRSTATDSEGTFRLNDLPPRSYTIFAGAAREYVPIQLPGAPAGDRRYSRIGDSVTIRMTRGGVITGRVANSMGEPVISVRVRAIRIRDGEGRRARSVYRPSRYTDDRGVYRIFGLQPGVYIVEAGGGEIYGYDISKYDLDIPIYYPASTRDAAAEVTVAAGGEVAGIDIRYRGEPGHVVSGFLTGLEGADSRYVPNITLRFAGSDTILGLTHPGRGERGGGFEFYGVPDGEYDATAERVDEKGGRMSAQPKRISVRGSNITGIELKMTPAATIAGKVVLEPAAKRCDAKRPIAPIAMDEILVQLQRDEPEKRVQISDWSFYNSDLAPGEKGEFSSSSVEPGRYRIWSNLPGENWYLKSVTGPQTAAANGAKPVAGVDLAQNPIVVKSGEKFDRIVVAVAEGAAGLRGTLEAPRAPMVVHLVPAETESANEVLRYAQTPAGNDGSFEFKQLAPGRYWLAVRPARPEDADGKLPSPAAWDPVERGKLRKEAAIRKDEVELQPCQRVIDRILKAL